MEGGEPPRRPLTLASSLRMGPLRGGSYILRVAPQKRPHLKEEEARHVQEGLPTLFNTLTTILAKAHRDARTHSNYDYEGCMCHTQGDRKLPNFRSHATGSVQGLVDQEGSAIGAQQAATTGGGEGGGAKARGGGTWQSADPLRASSCGLEQLGRE